MGKLRLRRFSCYTFSTCLSSVLNPPTNSFLKFRLLELPISESQVWPNFPHILELLPCILRLQRRRYNHIFTHLPVNRRRDTLLITSLQAINYTQDLSGVSPSARRIHHCQSDLLRWVNDEDTADGECDALLVNVVQILLVHHVIEPCHFSISICDDWELEVCLRDVVDVFNPPVMAAQIIGTESDHLYPSLLEFIFQFRECPQLGRADWGEVCGVGKEDCP